MKRVYSLIVLLMGLSVAAMAQETSKAPGLTTKFSGFVMSRYNYSSNANPSNSASLRVARVQAAGKIMGDFDYRLQVQVNGTSNSIGGPRIVDAYVEWQKYKAFYVKFGQFKRAFTFENPMNPIDQGFYGYGMSTSRLAGMNDRVNEHASNGRDIGLQFQGDLFEIADHPLLHYQIGLYNGQGINVGDVNDGKDLIGGLWFIPVEGARIGAFGWNGTYGRKFGGEYAEVKRVRYALSGEYKAKDWTFRSEYVHSYGAAFKNAYGGNLDLNTTIGDKADAWYALVIAPIIPNTFHAKARYDVYRDSASWDRSYTAYDLGLDYMFTRNLVISAIGSYVNDRRLAAGSHNYYMFDVQLSFRF